MDFGRDLIDKMKQWHRDSTGEEISDQEANEAWINLCKYFELLLEMDRKQERENHE